jgi:type I restriction enzyme S subunit
MSAVMDVREPSAKYLSALPPPLVQHFELMATAPGGVAKLRELILTLAVRGKLVPQDPRDEPASELLKKIRAEKDRLIAEGKIKRDEPSVPITEEEKPFSLPDSWEWVRIPEVTHGLGQGEPSSSFSYIDVASIDNLGGRVAPQVQVLEAADAPSRARKNVSMGTVIYSTIRPYLKNIAVIEHDYSPRAIASTAFAVLHPHAGVLPKYLLHYLRSRPFTEYVNSKAVGVAYPAINDANFFQGVIALPPAAEQTRIVTRVEELMGLCDALEAKGQLEAAQHAQLVQTLLGALTVSTSPEELADNWQRVATHFDLLLDRPEAIDALEQTILQLAVRGLLVAQDSTNEPAGELLKKIRLEKDRLILEGKIKRDKPLPPIAEEEQPFDLPEGWEWCQLDELVTIRGGKRVANGYQLSTVPTEFIYIRVSDMKDGSIDDADLRYLDAEMRSTISRYIITKDDIYMTIVGATIGKCGVVPERFDGMNLTENAARLTPHLLSKDYLFRLLSSEFCQTQFLGKTKQVGVQKMALNRLAGTLIPLPPLAEQSRIVARVESLRRLCNDLRQRLTARQTTQAHLAEALIDEVA